MRFNKLPFITLLVIFFYRNGQAQDSLSRGIYFVDKRIELKISKLKWVDKNTLISSMAIKQFSNHPALANPFFNQTLDCYAETVLRNDTIFIIGFMNGLLGFGFKLEIFGDSCIAASFALSDEKIYKYKILDKDSIEFIPLPSISQKVILSKKPKFEKGEIVEGFVDLKSVPFFYVLWKSKFWLEVRAYFKAEVL